MKSMQAHIQSAEPVLWLNPDRKIDLVTNLTNPEISLEKIQAAADRLIKFAPVLAMLFPSELSMSGGVIQSELIAVPHMQIAMGFAPNDGDWYVKADHSLPIAGSIKARGGFHEVLELAEKIAIDNGLINSQDSYLPIASPKAREIFSQFEVAVGSTGNLGLSIGVMAAALGFSAVVHMSADAKEWKKDRLRTRGVRVVEHLGDYEEAVRAGREMAAKNLYCHFVDDERSSSLFLGYAACAFELKAQLQNQFIKVDSDHPLYVYIPCGVGGAPAGIAWGLAQIFGEHVRCYFAEPVQSPCFLLQMLAKDGEHPSVYDFGLHNRTEADGLAVPRASLLAANAMKHVLAGSYTVLDQTLFDHLGMLYRSEGMSIEPSAAAGFSGPLQLKSNLQLVKGATHIIWTTGGSLVPQKEFDAFLSRSCS